jgi:pimeloyl-ACP methyl ester carboxylesterase
VTRALPRLEPLRYARTGTLDVAYYEAGPSDGAVVLLLHGFPYDQAEQLLAAQPPITVPAVTLDGLADGNFPATDGSLSAPHFTGPRVHHQVPGAGHNLPQEAPGPFARAVLELATPAMTAATEHPPKGTRP